MCLAPEVDVVAGAAITVVAVDSLRHVRGARSLPAAVIPAVLAAHSFMSAFVWWGLRGQVPEQVGLIAEFSFMLVAYVLLPVLVPLAVLLLEPRGWRRDALLVVTGAGLVSAVDYAQGLLQGTGQAVACNYYIDYEVTGSAPWSGLLYVAATAGALLLSGHRPLWIWGIVNAIAIAAISLWDFHALPSLWCGWAAITSVFIAWFMRRLAAAHDAGLPPPWADPESAPAPVAAAGRQSD